MQQPARKDAGLIFYNTFESKIFSKNSSTDQELIKTAGWIMKKNIWKVPVPHAIDKILMVEDIIVTVWRNLSVRIFFIKDD